MATKFKDRHLETEAQTRHTPKLMALVTAEDTRREHNEALCAGSGHPGYERAANLVINSENAAENLEGRTVQELLQESFEAFAETRNRHLLPN